MTDLSPGDYLVAAAAEVDDLQWQNAAYLESFSVCRNSCRARGRRDQVDHRRMGGSTMIGRTLTSLALLGVVAAASGQPHRLPRHRRSVLVRLRDRRHDPANRQPKARAVVRGRVTAADGRPLRLARVGIVETNTRRSMGTRPARTASTSSRNCRRAPT